jgi:hypothetical protein
MTQTIRLLITIALMICAVHGIAQSASTTLGTTTITEPAVYSVSDLFRHADKVAIVEVLSGDVEAYEIPLYKGRVVRPFKGVSADDIVYFGPFLGTELGSEYILFLKDVSQSLQPRRAGAGYGVVKYSKVFDEGYSSMLTSYECVFKGTEAQNCDHAVRICTDYIKVPRSLETAPPEGTDTPFGCRWARRQGFISMLDEIAHPPN